jgi:hypothetical protein
MGRRWAGWERKLCGEPVCWAHRSLDWRSFLCCPLRWRYSFISRASVWRSGSMIAWPCAPRFEGPSVLMIDAEIALVIGGLPGAEEQAFTWQLAVGRVTTGTAR